MANWNGLVMTDKGIALQSKVQAGEILNITKLKLGSGTLPAETDIRKLTDLIQPEQNLGIGGREPNGDYCKISATISNIDLETGYYVRELGVFAQDPDEGEILYAYTTDGAPDYLPAEGGSTVISQEFSVNIAVSDTDNIKVEIDPGALATMGYVQQQIKVHDDTEDAHAPAFTAHNADTSAHSPAFAAHNADTSAHQDMTGASSATAGKRGMVPAPAAGAQQKFLRGDGTWADVIQISNIINLIYPVGSYYMSEKSTNPSTLFPGTTWEALEQGRVLLAQGTSYPAGTTGGEATHKLTVEELPAHTHKVTVATTGAHTHAMTLKSYCYNAETTNHGWGGDDVAKGPYSNTTTSAGNHTHTVTLANTGSSTAHNNLQPYRAIYIWRRIN